MSARDVEPQVVGQPNGWPTAGSEGLRRRGNDHASEEFEDDGYEVAQEELGADESKWGAAIGVVSAMDLGASAVIFITAFKYAYLDNGVSLYCMGFQAVSHWLSSLLLVLRSLAELCPRKARDDTEVSLLEKRRTQLYTEQGVSVVMGCVMLISAASLLFKAFRKIRFWDRWYLDHKDMDAEAEVATDWLAWTGFSIYLLQAFLRGVAAFKLKTHVFGHACVASVVSFLFLFVLGIAASYQREWSWKAEPIAAVVLSFAMLVEGVRVVFYYFDDMDMRLQHDPRA